MTNAPAMPNKSTAKALFGIIGGRPESIVSTLSIPMSQARIPSAPRLAPTRQRVRPSLALRDATIEISVATASRTCQAIAYPNPILPGGLKKLDLVRLRSLGPLAQPWKDRSFGSSVTPSQQGLPKYCKKQP